MGQCTGNAAKMLASFPINDVSYNEATERLKHKFGDDKEIIDIHYTTLHNLPISNERFVNLLSTLNSIQTHCHSLRARHRTTIN